jgi:hypothetical protein
MLIERLTHRCHPTMIKPIFLHGLQIDTSREVLQRVVYLPYFASKVVKGDVVRIDSLAASAVVQKPAPRVTRGIFSLWMLCGANCTAEVASEN